MRHVTVILVCVFLVVSSVIAGTPVEPNNISKAAGTFTQGRLYLPELEFDFGFVPQDAAVSHSFWIENKGQDSLEIIQVKPG